MISGVGTDIVEVARIAKAVQHWGNHFLNHVYTPNEIAYCLRHKSPNEHFAGRFAAKEAVIKALPSHENLHWTDIEIINDKAGKPHCTVANRKINQPIHISISHTQSHAIAFAVITS